MPELQLRHEMGCDEETYWTKCIFDPEYNKRLFLDALQFKNYELVETKDDGKTLFRKIKIDPKVTGLPGPVKKAIGDSFAYVEEGTFDRATRRYTYRIIPSAFGEKSKVSGVIHCESLGDKKVARIADMKVEVKILMIGKLVEDVIIRDLKSSFATAAQFTTEFVREKGY